jgi:hypothetical protein
VQLGTYRLITRTYANCRRSCLPSIAAYQLQSTLPCRPDAPERSVSPMALEFADFPAGTNVRCYVRPSLSVGGEIRPRLAPDNENGFFSGD